IDQLFIAGAAASVAVFLKPVADVFTGWIRGSVEQGLGGNYETWCAEAALSSAVDHPGHLQGVKIARSSDTFDCCYGRPVLHPAHLSDAGTEQFAVDNDV